MALETVKIPDLPAMTATPSNTDEMIIRSSAGVQRIDYSVLADAIINRMKNNNTQSFVTTSDPTTSDYVHLYDSDGSALEQVTVADLLKQASHNMVTEEFSPQINTTYVSKAENLNGSRYGRVCIVTGELVMAQGCSSDVPLVTNIPRPVYGTRVIADCIQSASSYTIRPLYVGNQTINLRPIAGGLNQGDRLVFCAVYLANGD